MEMTQIQLASTAFMTGLIWVIQFLHYPAFEDIDERQFKAFHAGHSRVITFIVGPVMTLELFTAVGLFQRSPLDRVLQVNLGLLALTWVATAFLSVPLHNRLAQKRDIQVVRKLVKTNGIRTLLWSVRLLILLVHF